MCVGGGGLSLSVEMPRKSQGVGDRHYYTNEERKLIGFVTTKKDVLGADAFLPFGYCCLSLKAPKDPVATPEGFIYDKEFILQYLMDQKKELTAQLEQFEYQERKKLTKKRMEEHAEATKDTRAFFEAEQRLLSKDSRHDAAVQMQGAEEEESKTDKFGLSAKGEKMRELIHIDRQDFRKGSFWCAEETKTAKDAELKKPDTVPKCPMSGKKLRLKELIPLNLEVADEELLKQGGGRGMYRCAVSKKSITHQKVVVIKPTGVVLLEAMLKDCVYPTMTCPITSKKITKKDILNLQAGGTAFSAHNEVEAKKLQVIEPLGRNGAKGMTGHVGMKGTPYRG